MILFLVGRARPDYLERCFPDGKITDNLLCTGDTKSEMEGRKSFPSGHSSFAFAGFGFLSIYLMGKFQIFHKNGRGQSIRLILSILPLLAALLVAISRTCDYHHHWQDVTVGSLIGLGLAYLSYRQYYPSLSSTNCNFSYVSQNTNSYSTRTIQIMKNNGAGNSSRKIEDDGEKRLIDESEKDVKWI